MICDFEKDIQRKVQSFWLCIFFRIFLLQTQICNMRNYTWIITKREVHKWGEDTGKEIRPMEKSGKQMADRLTEFVAILDCSRSIYGKEQGLINGFNQWLREQKKIKGEAFLTLALFGNECRILYSHMPIRYVRELDTFSCYVHGNTACYDAVEEVLSLVDQIRNERRIDYQTDILVYLFTDGLDNASIRCTEEEMENLLEQKRQEGWKILEEHGNASAGFEKALQIFEEMRGE